MKQGHFRAASHSKFRAYATSNEDPNNEKDHPNTVGTLPTHGIPNHSTKALWVIVNWKPKFY